MKRYLLLVLAVILLLSGCDSFRESDNTLGSGDGQNRLDEQDTAYQSIATFKPENYELCYFAFEGDDIAVSISLPSEWDFQLKNGMFEMTRESVPVATLMAGTGLDVMNWTLVSREEDKGSKLTTETYLERSGSGTGAQYRYRFVYTYTVENSTKTLSLIADYAEICDFTKSKCQIPTLEKTVADAGLGKLRKLSHAQNILILGNSFISSSNIGGILQDMLWANDHDIMVLPISIGYANVQSLVEDETLMNEIASGYYEAVFICGFYSTSQTESLAVLRDICDGAESELVIFPAHNENEAAIRKACRENPELVCINWKEELDNLIKSGVSRSTLCINDTHQHSTDLAGFVGAHMIYRAMYGELPEIQNLSAVSENYVSTFLGDYPYTGVINTVPIENCYWLPYVK